MRMTELLWYFETTRDETRRNDSPIHICSRTAPTDPVLPETPLHKIRRSTEGSAAVGNQAALRGKGRIRIQGVGSRSFFFLIPSSVGWKE